jgi:hypothetical protein
MITTNLVLDNIQRSHPHLEFFLDSGKIVIPHASDKDIDTLSVDIKKVVGPTKFFIAYMDGNYVIHVIQNEKKRIHKQLVDYVRTKVAPLLTKEYITSHLISGAGGQVFQVAIAHLVKMFF